MASVKESRPRVIATTDGEIDDRCSMIRFLMYANEWNIEGLIYCSSRFHWKGHNWAGTDWIENQIDTYAEVYDNLIRHDPAYPSPQKLRDLVYVGNIDSAGAMDENTPGSNRIVDVLLNNEPGPVYLQAWGGTNTIARALWEIQHEHPDQMERVAEKAIIYIILNQDRTLREYIQPNWPDLQILNSFKQFGVFAYAWDELVPEEQRVFLEDEWMEEHILREHGPLCSAYPTAQLEHEYVTNGLEPSQKGHNYFHSEGDTPAYLHQIQTGLGSLEHPSFGGWGGRFEQEPGSKNVWIGTEDDRDLYKPIWRWVPDIQRDWAARADWCVESYEEANHPPDVVVDGESGKGVIRFQVRPGENVDLDAAGTSDPDGDRLNYDWWNYRDVSSYSGKLQIKNNTEERATVKIPLDAADRRIHVLLTVRDDGEPSLCTHRRVILDIQE